MALSLSNLDDRTRKFMIAEFDSDVTNNQLYLSNRLTAGG